MWLYQKTPGRIFSPETGAKFEFYYSEREHYEVEIKYLGPVAGLWQAEMMEVRERINLFFGSEEGALDYLGKLAETLKAVEI
jgi:hypothetical protein